MTARQHALSRCRPPLGASLADDLADALPHGALQNPVAVLCRPNGVIFVMKSGAYLIEAYAEVDRFESGAPRSRIQKDCIDGSASDLWEQSL